MTGDESPVVEEPGEAGSVVEEREARLETTPLFLIKGEASDEEVAALTAVLSAIAANAAPAPEPPRSEWAANHRKVRLTPQNGPGGWRASTLPR